MEIQQTKDTIVDALTTTKGKKLEIMANIKNGAQAMAVYECWIGMALGSKFAAEQAEFILRMSVSSGGRGREDLTGIGKTPDIQGWQRQDQS